MNLKKIIIVGTSGCGKTSLAQDLSQKLNIPYFDLDDYYWRPHWQIQDLENFRNNVERITQNKSWIMTGNYPQVRDLIWSKSQIIIWLDYSFLRCFYQGLFRSLRRIIYKIPCCNGNYENFSNVFLSKDSILLWIIKTHRLRRKNYNEIFNKLAKITMIRFI